MGYEIYNFGRPFLGHHYFIFTLSDLCLGVDKQETVGPHRSPENKFQSINTFAHDKIRPQLIKEKNIIFSLKTEWSLFIQS